MQVEAGAGRSNGRAGVFLTGLDSENSYWPAGYLWL